MYTLNFIQKSRCKDGSDHLHTYIYKFFVKETKLIYILKAEYHNENVIALKFYCKKDKRSPYKYNKIINKCTYKVVIGILDVCTLLIPKLLKLHPNCNFALCSSRTIDFSNPEKLTESIKENQRFRIYSRFIQDRIGNKTFTHFEYPDISCYLLVNNENKNIEQTERKILEMFSRTYITIPDIN